MLFRLRANRSPKSRRRTLEGAPSGPLTLFFAQGCSRGGASRAVVELCLFTPRGCWRYLLKRPRPPTYLILWGSVPTFSRGWLPRY